MLYLVSSIEWMAFVCNYSFGAKWRESLIEGPRAQQPNTLVTCILANSKSILILQLHWVYKQFIACNELECIENNMKICTDYMKICIIFDIWKLQFLTLFHHVQDFRNVWGVWVIAGLHVLPVWLLGIKYNIFETHLWFLPPFIQPLGECIWQWLILQILLLDEIKLFKIRIWVGRIVSNLQYFFIIDSIICFIHDFSSTMLVVIFKENQILSGILLLGMGRLLCFCVEIWSIWNHIYGLLMNTSSCWDCADAGTVSW